MKDTKVNVGTPGHIDHGTKDSGMPVTAYLSDSNCTICGGKGLICVGTSGSDEDGNCSITEPCDCVIEIPESYLQSRIAEAEERQRVRCAKAFDAEYGDHSGENEYYECMKAILNAGGQDDEHR